MATRFFLPACAAIILMTSCRKEAGEISVEFVNDALTLVALRAEDRDLACLGLVLVYRYDDQGREHLIRRYEPARDAACVNRLDLNGQSFLVSRSGNDIKKGDGNTYNVHVNGLGIDRTRRITA